MIRVGNDIVDLKSPFAKGKSKDKRFTKRVLTEAEQRLVDHSPFPDDLLWIFWAAKETAYKAIAKSNPGISSAPKRYQVFIGSKKKGMRFKGVVKTPGQQVQIVVYHHGDAIHCIGKTGSWKENGPVIHGIQKIDDAVEPNYYQSSTEVSNHVRRIATEVIADHMVCDKENITIYKVSHSDDNAYPAVRISNRKCPIDISFSHDGRYVAYVFSVDNN